jgi:multiple sugar transport system substrate-binding protein
MMKRRSRPQFTLCILLLVALLLAACGGQEQAGTGQGEQASPGTEPVSPPPAGATSPEPDVGVAPEGPPEGDVVTIRYALWDANQLPAYQACAAQFSEQNPNIAVKIEQLGWDDYWSGIQTGFVAGTAPDVFTNHLAKYPEFAQSNQIVDIQPLVERDGVDTEQYIGELAELWTREGKRYGLPKDWDTVAVVYNKQMLEEAGIDPAMMEDWTWNPDDGGEFQEVIAKLTIDANGNNALSPDFDANNIQQYGFTMPGQDSGEAYGQTQWSHFAASTGWRHVDELWGNEYHYDDPRFIETIQWYAGLMNEKNYAIPFQDIQSLGGDSLFAAGRAAMTTHGSWMIGYFLDNTDFDVGFGILPIGPEGRKSMFNGLADSIWVGSQHQEEAWEWVKYLASPECQETVGEHGVVFPAIQSGVDNALKAYEERGVDVTAFTEIALDPEGTFLFPVTEHASEIVSIMEPVMDSIMLGQAQAADVLPEADQRVDALFK